MPAPRRLSQRSGGTESCPADARVAPAAVCLAGFPGWVQTARQSRFAWASRAALCARPPCPRPQPPPYPTTTHTHTHVHAFARAHAHTLSYPPHPRTQPPQAELVGRLQQLVRTKADRRIVYQQKDEGQA